jgi:hypothetical protein
MRHGQVLFAHLLLINPQAKSHSFLHDLLWAMAKASGALRSQAFSLLLPT